MRNYPYGINKKKGHISLKESEILNNALSAYKTAFEPFFYELKKSFY